MECVYYVTALDINMGYYTVSISPENKGMKKAVAKVGKFRYNCVAYGNVRFGRYIPSRGRKSTWWYQGSSNIYQ